MMKRIYLDTCVWCRPFDEPSQRVTEEAGAFFRILRMVNEGEVVITSSVVLDDETDRIRNAEYFITADDNILRKSKDIMRRYKIKVCAPTEFVESEERKDDI